MRHLLTSLAAAALLAACSTITPKSPQAPVAPKSAVEALDAYYNSISTASLPRAPGGRSLPASDAVLTRILVASCNNEEAESAALARVSQETGDLFLMIGDNVYGDRDGRDYAVDDPELAELRRSFADLAARPEFLAVRATIPMLATWDDHDYGSNDGGREFAFKRYSEIIHETFWGVPGEVKARPGVYDSYIFGPEGQRVQIILLDTRYFRSPLNPTDAYGAEGKERYIPSTPEMEQDMLGEAQWNWLAQELVKDADIRLVVSSIQVLPDNHGWEAWRTMPEERARLYQTISDTGAKGVVFLSGDRHAAFLYRNTQVLPYPAYELTSSSLNMSFSTETSERDVFQIGAGYTLTNFGDVVIDWDAGTIALSILSESGEPVLTTQASFAEIGVR